MTSLSGHDLTCIRGYTPIFSGISFRVTAGETLLLTGANGCGKTTLLRIISGLLPATEGCFSLDGQDTADTSTLRRNVFFLSQDIPLKPRLGARENLVFLLELLGLKTNPDHLLTLAGLSRLADYPAGYLSSGQKRRLILSLLHALNRKILLLDEPTTCLDKQGIAELQQTLGNFCKSGGCVIIATHNPELFDGAKILDLERIAA